MGGCCTTKGSYNMQQLQPSADSAQTASNQYTQHTKKIEFFKKHSKETKSTVSYLLHGQQKNRETNPSMVSSTGRTCTRFPYGTSPQADTVIRSPSLTRRFFRTTWSFRRDKIIISTDTLNKNIPHRSHVLLHGYMSTLHSLC